MTVDKKQLYNGALRICKAGRLKELTDNTAARYHLDNAWDEDVIGYCLELGNWQWAARNVRLDYDNTITTQFGFQYAFQAPEDYKRLIDISGSEMMNEPLRAYRYRAQKFFSNYDKIYIEYVSDDNEYGRDYSLWTDHFAELVKAELAKRIAGNVVDSNATIQMVEQYHEKALSDAMGHDSIQRPTRPIAQGNWSKSRSGWAGSTRDRFYRGQ